jgi:hypothetical protein
VPGDPTQLASELAREREEVARLRALLVAKDADLGRARGRLLELETGARYVLGTMRRIRKLPAFLRKLLGGARPPRS